MSKYRKGALYIRRMKEGDQSESIITAMRMAYHQIKIRNGISKKAYVLVRHGYDSVMSVGSSKASLMITLMFSRKPGLTKKQKMRKWGKQS
ncbi:hypothetical protein GRF56_16790 [Aeromonas veronii]|uniref:hypothetical protein n=1 Tax=Aeromonas veronii TaxID=654 RepID=UPI00131703C1|nr:hypothetical protein [Aeromonas veronii]QHC08935.1 hypothetical protein GRF56_16790 [Aeromonas veronii]